MVDGNRDHLPRTSERFEGVLLRIHRTGSYNVSKQKLDQSPSAPPSRRAPYLVACFVKALLAVVPPILARVAGASAESQAPKLGRRSSLILSAPD